MAKYLITGGAGFIGSHIAETLLKRGESVRVLDNLTTGRQINLEALRGQRGEVEITHGDLRDREAIQAAARGVEVIFHQAAQASDVWSTPAPRLCTAMHRSCPRAKSCRPIRCRLTRHRSLAASSCAVCLAASMS